MYIYISMSRPVYLYNADTRDRKRSLVVYRPFECLLGMTYKAAGCCVRVIDHTLYLTMVIASLGPTRAPSLCIYISIRLSYKFFLDIKIFCFFLILILFFLNLKEQLFFFTQYTILYKTIFCQKLHGQQSVTGSHNVANALSNMYIVTTRCV